MASLHADGDHDADIRGEPAAFTALTSAYEGGTGREVTG